MALTLAIMIWLGSQARSKAGMRIAFSRGVYACRMALPDLNDIYQSTKSIKPT